MYQLDTFVSKQQNTLSQPKVINISYLVYHPRTSSDAFLYLHQRYLELIEQQYPGDLSALLKSFNGPNSLNELTRRILQFAEQSDQPLPEKRVLYDFSHKESPQPQSLDFATEREVYSYMYEQAKRLISQTALAPVAGG